MYQLAVKIEPIEKRKRSTGLLHLLASFLLLGNSSYYLQLSAYKIPHLLILIFITAVASLIYGFFRKKLDVTARFNHWLRMLQFLSAVILGVLMINIGRDLVAISLLLLAAVIIMLLFTERKVFHDTDMLLNEEGIFVPGYFTNHRLSWPIIKEVVIREDYITIFRKNGKYLQFELLKGAEAAQLGQMTDFCKQQIIRQKGVLTTNSGV